MILRNFWSVKLFMCNLIVCILCFNMVMTHAGVGGSGSGSGLGTGTEPVDEGLYEFITSEIMRGTLDATPMMFRKIKEGNIKIMAKRFQDFQVEMSAG